MYMYIVDQLLTNNEVKLYDGGQESLVELL